MSVKFVVLIILTSVACLGMVKLSAARIEQQDNPPADGGVKLVASVAKARFQLGERISLKLSLRNQSDQERKLISTGIKDYQVEIKDARGKELRRTTLGEARKRSEVISISKGPLTLQPGEEREQGEIVLTDIFDLTSRGEYTIVVKRSGPRLDHSSATIESEKLTITIE